MVLNIRHQSEMFNRKRGKPGKENPGRTEKWQPAILLAASGWPMIRTGESGRHLQSADLVQNVFCSSRTEFDGPISVLPRGFIKPQLE
jgi:hypothetical protein